MRPLAWCIATALAAGPMCAVAAVRFIRPDPLSNGYRVEFNLSFALGDRVFELKYQNVDDGEPNTFVQSADELIGIAEGVVSRASR